jgi:hypothetical protein
MKRFDQTQSMKMENDDRVSLHEDHDNQTFNCNECEGSSAKSLVRELCGGLHKVPHRVCSVQKLSFCPSRISPPDSGPLVAVIGAVGRQKKR